MAVLETSAIVCSLRPHGEYGVIARLMTPGHGLVAGYVRGGRSRRMRPILIPGNIVAARLQARTTEQLAGLTVELEISRAPLHNEPLPAAAIEWACLLAADALPEGQPYPAIHAALGGLLQAIEYGGVARKWAVALIRFEMLLLDSMGYGGLPLTTDMGAALRRNREALADHVLHPPRSDVVLAMRDRLVERLGRAIA